MDAVIQITAFSLAALMLLFLIAGVVLKLVPKEHRGPASGILVFGPLAVGTKILEIPFLPFLLGWLSILFLALLLEPFLRAFRNKEVPKLREEVHTLKDEVKELQRQIAKTNLK